jgi:hypothetical protein
MKVKRMIEVETNCPEIGDRIHVDHYTATCQEITPKGALFLMDQYLDKAFPMNWDDTNEGGYEKSDLRKALQSDEVLNIFAGIRNYMVPFENGDLLRIPFAGEFFGDKLPEWCEPDDHEQWPLMRDRRNRLASRCGDYEDYEWSWLQNKDKTTSMDFCFSDSCGFICVWFASKAGGVRLAFLIATCRKTREEAETCHS